MVDPGSCQVGIAAGMAALQLFYNLSTGLWDTTEWWNAANALETTIDYSHITQTSTYAGNLVNTFYKPRYKDFFNPWFNDDDGWWALTWIKAYDLTGEKRYLDAAVRLFDQMTTQWDNKCSGGIWWKKTERGYKNAITNSLFLTIAVRLHQRLAGDRYLDWAQRTWRWFQASGMINRQNLVNDGLDDACQNNGKTAWTYNQGVLVGGLVDLYKVTGDAALLAQAEAIADAAIVALAPNGILQEPCEANNECEPDGTQFKGIFMRNLLYLYQTLPKSAYQQFIRRNAETIWAQSRNSSNQLGLVWAGPFDKANAARQSSAMDAINAAIHVGTRGLTYQAETGTLHGDSFVAKSGTGYRGRGYVITNLRQDHRVRLAVEVACDGWYELQWRYAAGDREARRYIHVNGRTITKTQSFPKTATWSDWTTTKLPKVWLKAGLNQISVIGDVALGSQGLLHLDELIINPASLKSPSGF
jgi:rhamnogalacturonyl hydrolase YesR